MENNLFRPWALYDRLLDGIPEDAAVLSCVITPIWTVVCTTVGAGIALTPIEIPHHLFQAGTLAGMPLRRVAEYVKSWDSNEAALGLAAVNAWYNSPLRVDNPFSAPLSSVPSGGILSCFEPQISGKKVAVIGHYPTVSDLGKVCKLSVLERICQPGDFPDPACEYLLPEQDVVFITASALENKTMPRLLDLCRDAYTVIWGSSTPLTPILFDFGAYALFGNIIMSPEDVIRVAGEGGISTQLMPYMARRLLTIGKK